MLNETSKDKLKSQILLLIDYCEKRISLNQRLNIGIGLAGILLGLGATVAGIVYKQDASLAAIFGAGSATTQSILFAYPVNKRERVHRAATARLKNLLGDLEIREDIDVREIEKLLEELKDIRLKAFLEDDGNNNVEEQPSQPSPSKKPISPTPNGSADITPNATKISTQR